MKTSKFSVQFGPRWMAAFIDEDMNNPHINTLVFTASIANFEWPILIPNFFCKCWKTFGNYWWFEILMFITSFFVFTSRTNFLVLVELECSSLPSCFQESASCVFSCRLTWEYSIGSRLGFRISFLMLGAPPCSFSTFSGLTELLKSWRGFFLALNGLYNTRFMSLDFAIAEFIGFGFAIGAPSLEVASCPLLDMALCFLIGSERKLLKWLQENIDKFMMLKKRRRWFQSSRVKLSLVSISASWLLASTYLIWFCGS